jgi:tetratricopeptide (TPR) repeat protein
MNTSAVAVLLIFSVAFLVMGIEIAHQKVTTGVVDMKAARRWFYRTVGAALVLLLGLAIFDLANFGRARLALADAQAGAEAARRHDPDTAINLYNKAIEAGTLPAGTLADVFKARGMARLQKQDWEGAVLDFDEALKRKTDDPEARYGLSLAHSGAGDDEAALRELDRVIALGRNPDDLLPDAYAARGDIYLTFGQYQRGLQDFDEALRRRPNDAGALGGRGEAYFYLGQFDKAEADLRAAADRDPKTAYYPLWLFLALSHQGKDGKAELDRRAEKLDLKSWPGPVVELYRGKIGTDNVLSATRIGDAKTQRDQQCEADFYLGEHALLADDKEKAERLLDQAVNSCDHRFIEYAGAKAELARTK